MCRIVLDTEPGNAAALNILGVIAAHVGEIDHARIYLEAALQAEPTNEQIRVNLTALMQAPDPSLSGKRGGGYLVIKAWGYGFWSDVSSVLGSLLLAEITGRIPVTHWGPNSLFSDGSDRDAFRIYFEPVSNVSLHDLAGLKDADFFPQKWNHANLASEDVAKWHGDGSRVAAIHFLNRPETIAVNDFYIGVIDVAPWAPADHPMHGKSLDAIYRYLIKKYLTPVRAIRSSCEAFARKHLDNGPFAAVHMRGSDKITEYLDLASTNQSYIDAIDSIDPAWRIFLLTDDERLRAQMAKTYGDRIVTTICQRTDTSTGVHYLPFVARVQAGIEVMTDTYLALRADRFIGNGSSNVSTMIAVLKDWAPADVTLLSRPHYNHRSPGIHLRDIRKRPASRFWSRDGLS